MACRNRSGAPTRFLRWWGLEDKAHAYARTLSGGHAPAAAAGQGAGAITRRVLVLDEPTAGVDIELRRMLWDNVRKLNAEGMTIVLTTHYLEEAEEMCDQIAIINHGQLVAQDTTQALLGRFDAKTMLIRPEEPPERLPHAEGLEVEAKADGTLAITYQTSRTSCRRGAGRGARRRCAHQRCAHRTG